MDLSWFEHYQCPQTDWNIAEDAPLQFAMRDHQQTVLLKNNKIDKCWNIFRKTWYVCAVEMTIIGVVDDKSSLENVRLPRLTLNTHTCPHISSWPLTMKMGGHGMH